MNEIELAKWCESAKYICSDGNYDDNGNCYSYSIYEKNDKLYRIDYCNGFPNEKLSENGNCYIRNVYEPILVEKHTEMVERITFIPVKG